MFDSLKAKANEKAYQSLVDSVTPKIAPLLEQVNEMAPELVLDDAKYRSHVVEPAWLALGGLTGGVASLIPNLRGRFLTAMLHARSELLVIDNEKRTVTLAGNAHERLAKVLLEGLQKTPIEG